LGANSIRGVAAGAPEHKHLTNIGQWPMSCESLRHPRRPQSREQAVGASRNPNIGNNQSTDGSAQDDNGCRWEWKFSLDADRRPELWCRCQTCGVKYYLSRWEWTLDSDRHAKCLPPTGKDLFSGDLVGGGSAKQVSVLLAAAVTRLRSFIASRTSRQKALLTLRSRLGSARTTSARRRRK
jgi:hypothetical protein